MKKGIIRKTVSLMIFALLFSGVCSTTVLAATVANIGSKNYSSLDKALKEARNGQTITLKKNAVYHTNWLGYFGGSIVNKSSPELNKKITINLNGKKLTVKDHNMTATTGGQLYINNNVTIKNGTLIGGVTVKEKGYITLNKVKLKHGNSVKSSTICVWGKNAKALVKDCSCDNIYFTIGGGKGARAVCDGCTFSANSGSMFALGSNDDMSASLQIMSGKYTYSGFNYLADIQKSGTLKVSGGTFSIKGTDNLAGFGNNGKMIIESGSFSSESNVLVYNHNLLTISGGTLNGKSRCIIGSGDSQTNISGGTLSTNYRYACVILLDGPESKCKVTGGKLNANLGGSCISGYRRSISVGDKVKLYAPGVDNPIAYSDQDE